MNLYNTFIPILFFVSCVHAEIIIDSNDLPLLEENVNSSVAHGKNSDQESIASFFDNSTHELSEPTLTLDSIAGTSETGDNLGHAIAKGDFNGDGYVDIAIGVPGESVGSVSEAGMVNIIYGSSTGLTDSGNQGWHQDSGSIAGGAEVGDNFGYSVTTGDFDGDGYDDLAVGVPGESIGSVSEAGMVNIIYGSSTGLTASGNQGWDQNSGSIAGVAEVGDNFGFSVTTGDFDGDGYDDLTVGVPDESVDSVSSAGMVNVLYGSGTHLTDSGNQSWHQND